MARNLAALIEERGTNAAQLARDAKLNPTGVYDILSGKSGNPRLDTLDKIADALKVPIARLFADSLRDKFADELISIFERLTPAERVLLLSTATAWIDVRSHGPAEEGR